jgi:hypothetical protein
VKRRVRVGHATGVIQFKLTGVALLKALKPDALASRLLRVAATAPSKEVRDLLRRAALVLMDLPDPKRGRKPKASTLRAFQQLAELQSKHGAARAVSRETGEDVETIRRRLRKKPGKGGT